MVSLFDQWQDPSGIVWDGLRQQDRARANRSRFGPSSPGTPSCLLECVVRLGVVVLRRRVGRHERRPLCNPRRRPRANLTLFLLSWWGLELGFTEGLNQASLVDEILFAGGGCQQAGAGETIDACQAPLGLSGLFAVFLPDTPARRFPLEVFNLPLSQLLSVMVVRPPRP